jgi:hypothetical protein
VSATFFSSFQEEYPMTFQLGIVTDDGVMLASDRLITNLSGVRHSFQAPKITVHKDQGFAHCSSGDEFFETFTAIIRQEIDKKTVDFVEGDPMEVCRVLTECVNQARREETENARKQNAFPGRSTAQECIGGNTMLIFRGERGVALWKVETLRPYPSVTQILPGNCIIGGDPNSRAVFFVDWYFPRVPYTLEAMIPLAVHTVLMAKDRYIDGLEIGLFSLNTFGTLKESELKPYIELSERIDSEILKRLGKNPQRETN